MMKGGLVVAGKGSSGGRRAKEFVETAQKGWMLYFVYILYIFLIYCFEGDDGSPVYTYVILLKNLLRSSLICQLHFNKAI